ncbi:hypothetical protein FJT64_008674 [Amphibalanus amphitrite]|uniref:ATP-dependent DNA helicase n=1 Tax=Amphibalanus amphitrite TaxID=1232801 RepID=A0A6A4VQ80_AMPAM|nr:hypothetical protein FJT64_008674 [Amphibalanus amphitrite]
MVLRPVHLVVSVLRLRANQVPFCKHGTISYPLKDACRARNLPWYDFERLPFVVLVQSRRDGTSAEAMVNMQTILRAKHFMERTMECKYNPRQTRPFYRFVGEQWMPFSNENLAALQRRLSEPDRPSTPAGLRVVLASDIHARADKVLRFHEFCNWLESGFTMADELWKSFRLSRSGEGADTTEAGQDDLWEVIENFVVGQAVDAAADRHNGGQHERRTDDDDESDADEIDVTMRHVLNCAVANGWLLPAPVDGDNVDSTGEPSSVLLRCCEELEMLGREFGNDEGVRAGGISAGAVCGPHSERPEDIRRQGIARSALLHIPMPGVDRENPLPESTPGYMQMAFPEVFRSGDADPYQDRKVSIRQPVTSWRQNWLHWMSRQPEAEGNVDLQFVVSNQLSRDKTGQEANVAIRMTDFPDGLPTKEQLENDPALCKRLAQSLLCLRSKLEDSDAYWRVQKQDAIGISRYLESPPPWRSNAIPMEVYLWQTRAVPYNHHPAIHRLCDNAAVNEALSDERYLHARLANTLRHPGIVAWMSALIGELDTLALSVARHSATYFLVRSEWGANANPHIHRHVISESFSRFLHQLQTSLKNKVAEIERDLRVEDPTLKSDDSRVTLETRVSAVWRDCQQEYVRHIGRCYTNWNAGLTKDGERTFDFAYDRKTTVCRASMAVQLDDALSTGDFAAIDELYVRVINGTLRHTGHSGRGDAPSAKDGCAVRRPVVDKAATEAARSADGRAKQVKKEVIVCKRRMPRHLRTEPAVVIDAHDPRIYQFETASNDKWLGSHDPFTILHVLNNVDDKAVVPAWLTRTPRVEWKSSPTDSGGYTFNVLLAQSRGDGSVEYALKYTMKPVAPIRTTGDMLLSAMERREASDNVDIGVVQKMYNQAAASMCQSIFQAVHKNWQLPLLQKNLDVRRFSMSGCRVVKPANAAANPVYVYADSVERFNARLGVNIRHGNIPLADIRRKMSVYEFCDTFTCTEKTIDGQRVFQISRRQSSWCGVLKTVMLAPHHGISKANPARVNFWKYARDIVLWCQPCLTSQELMPPIDCLTDCAIAAHWRAMYEQLMASDVHKPVWVTRYYEDHKRRAAAATGEDVSDESDSDDDDDGDNADDAADVVEPPEVEEERELMAQRVRDRFYQTALDAMLACPAEDIDDAVQRADRAAASVANPAGYDFQAQWLGDRIVNPEHVRRNYGRLASLGAGDAAHSAPVTPSGRQLVLPRLVTGYLKEQREWRRSCREWNAYDQAVAKWRRNRSSRIAEPVAPLVPDIRDKRPKALRAFLLGDPGAGKSTTLRSAVHELNELLVPDEADWTDVVKLSAPTGCASFHMAHGATTIHRLFAIRVGQVGDDPLPAESRQFAALCERLGPELGLLIFDEFSMIQRRMMRWIVKRLEEAGINLDDIGVVLVGDPAQILPIGDSPVWSLRQRMDDGKDCCEASRLGMLAFREVFRMPALETVDGFAAWSHAASREPNTLSDAERRAVARFRAAALDGDYETVYLNEVRRTVQNDELADHFTKVIIPSFRYGRATHASLQWLRDNTATAEHMAADPLWAGAVTLHGNHWFSELAVHRATVESDNARALVRFANERDTPVMAVNAQHLPTKKAARLQKVSPREFRSIPAVFFACSGLPLMLLENVAPSVGLFNGAHVEFVGPLYLEDDWQVTLSSCEYRERVRTSGVTLTTPLDTPASDRERMYQVPVGSVIVKVNGHTVDGDEHRLDELVAASSTVQLVFHTPKHPPHLPEFIVVRVPNYTENRGPNILGIEDADDLVPIRMVKRARDKGKNNRAIGGGEESRTEFRVGPPLEGGSAFTGFKGQGATLDRMVAKVKAWVETPGFWTVVVSRVRHPHHLHIPTDQWPTVEEIQVQRLNPDVLEAEIFERQMKINAAKTWRQFVAADDDGQWSSADNVIGDAVHVAWRRLHTRDVASIVCDELHAKGVDVSVVGTDQDGSRWVREAPLRPTLSSVRVEPVRPEASPARPGQSGELQFQVTNEGRYQHT